MRVPGWWIAVTALFALTLAGCEGGESGQVGDGPGGAVVPENQGDDADQAEESEIADENEPNGPRIPVTRGEPLAVLEGPLDGAVTAQINRFERRGRTVELSFTIVNIHEDEGWGAGWGRSDHFLDGGLDPDDPARGSIYGVTLVDGENAKRHYALRDPEGRCVCTHSRVNAPPGESFGLSATFPAPPDDVESMSVHIPEFGSIQLALQ